MTAKPSYEELERRVQELDIIESEYKHLLEVSQENESLFKRLYEKAPLGYQSLDENGQFLVVNPTWLDTLGYAKEEVIGKSFAEFLHPDWQDHFKENFPRFNSIGEVLGVEFEMVKKNGDPILVSFTGKISRDNKGDFQQTHCIFHDITERKQAEDGLRESEERYREIVELAVDGILQGSADGKIIGANSQMQKWLGRPLEQLLGLHVSELFDPDELKAKPLRFDLLNLTQPLVNERNLRRSDGTSLPVEMHSKRMPDGTYQSIYRDITERKKVEEALKKSERFLSATVDGLTAHITLLDDQGEIILTNKAYRDFAEQNGIKPRTVSEGVNYLAVCDTASGEHSEEATPFAKGIRDVLSGKCRSFALEYPCHSPGEERWFIGHVTPFVDEGSRQVIVAHENITKRKQAEEALQRSEEKFRQIITSVREGILSLDADWHITFANGYLAEMFGYELDELLGQSFELFFYEEDLEDFERRKHERQQGQYSQFERRFKTKDGREIWAIVSASAFRDDNGDFAGSFGTITDITERKRAEQMLRGSEEQLSSIFRSAPIGIGLVVNRELMSVNSRLCEMTGFDEGDLIGQSSRILYPSNEDFEFVGREKYAQIRDHGTGTVETHWQRKDGIIIDVLLSSTPVDMRDHSNGVTFTALDITERKRVERFLKDIITKNPMSIQILDKDGLTIEVNHAYKSLFGDVPPSDYSLFNDPQLLKMGIGKLFDQLRNGATVSFPDAYFNAHDSLPEFPDDPAWVRAIGFPLNDSSGKPEKFVLMHENITERKEHEKEQLKNEKLGSLGILAGGIAHDFNNILTAIMGNISLAKVFLDSTHKSYTPLAEAEKASVRAGELAHQLLTFARGGEPIKKVVAPQHLVNEAVSLALHGSNVKAIIDIHDSIHAIEADEGQMSQMFHNLIINATQAMPGGGTLTVTALNEILAENNSLSLPPGTYIRLTFADQGCGISDDDLKKIFDPYFTTKSAGNGLGLASLHSIINRHGGHIAVSSVVGKGTTFTILLPSLGEIYTKFQTGIATQAIDRHKGGSILVMDDEEMIRDIASSMLTHLGYEVTTCAGGEEAVELYKNSIESGTPFLAVIMDLTIPGGLGGKEAAKQILSVFPKACLIVSSGYSNDPIMSSCREYGFSGTIAKPYNIDEFKQLLGSLFALY